MNVQCANIDEAGEQRPVANAYLGVELDVGCAKADEAGEEGLIQMAVLLEGHVLDHRRQLVVVPYQNHPLQPTVPVFLPLQV